jgi:hypothetical protein
MWGEKQRQSKVTDKALHWPYKAHDTAHAGEGT